MTRTRLGKKRDDLKKSKKGKVKSKAKIKKKLKGKELEKELKRLLAKQRKARDKASKRTTTKTSLADIIKQRTKTAIPLQEEIALRSKINIAGEKLTDQEFRGGLGFYYYFETVVANQNVSVWIPTGLIEKI